MKGNGKESRKAKPTGECPLKVGVNRGNHPSWYTRDFVPQIGANWSVLSSIRDDNKPFGEDYGKVTLNAAGYYPVAIGAPVDPYNGFGSKMRELYALIRRSNSGAANYTAADLEAYIYNVVVIRALCFTAIRALAATRASGPMYRDSPEIFSLICGYDFETESKAYATNYNNLALLMKDVESLPIPDLALMDRFELICSSVFQDSNTTRPALFSMVPECYFEYEITTSGLTGSQMMLNPTHEISDLVGLISNLYTKITHNDIRAIIRGDMIKAFGSQAFKNNLLSKLELPLQVTYNEDLLIQLENATVIGGALQEVGGNMMPVDIKQTFADDGGTYALTISDNASFGLMGRPSRPINFHGVTAPSPGDLMAITRLDLVTTFDANKVTITACSGVILLDFIYVKYNDDTAVYEVTSVGKTLQSSHSTVQSTAVAAYKELAWLASVIDRFPMILWTTRQDDGYTFLFDIDNFAILTDELRTQLTIAANRSLGAIPGVTSVTTAISANRR